MRLLLHIPPAWTIKDAPDGRQVAVLPGEPRPLAILTWEPLSLRPFDADGALERAAKGGLEPGSSVQLGPLVERSSQLGWPMRMLDVEVQDRDGSLIECRLCVLYSFMEHTSFAMVRTQARARRDELATAVTAILDTARPAWDQRASLAEQWDLESLTPGHARSAVDARRVKTPELTAAALAITPGESAADQLGRAKALLDAARPADALEILTALAFSQPRDEAIQYLRGIALGRLDRHTEAAEAWEQALALAPGRADTHYNLAQAQFRLGRLEAALAGFRRVIELEPSDFLADRKLIQCLFALERFDDGHAARAALRTRWLGSTDPRARLVHEYVFDQFKGPGFLVHGVETLRPRSNQSVALFEFRAVDERDQPLPATVLIETSEAARQAGTPYVLGVESGNIFNVIATLAALPPYPELRRTVADLLTRALAKQGRQNAPVS